MESLLSDWEGLAPNPTLQAFIVVWTGGHPAVWRMNLGEEGKKGREVLKAEVVWAPEGAGKVPPKYVALSAPKFTSLNEALRHIRNDHADKLNEIRAKIKAALEEQKRAEAKVSQLQLQYHEAAQEFLAVPALP